jgi:hypothetical protein
MSEALSRIGNAIWIRIQAGKIYQQSKEISSFEMLDVLF